MSLEILSRDVLLRAQEQKEALVQNLTKECSSLETSSNELIENFKSKLSSQNDLEIKNQEEKIVGNFKSQSKKLVLDTKSQILSDVEKQAYDNLINLESKEKKTLFKSLLKLSTTFIKADVIYTNPSDVKLVQELTKVDVKSQKDIHGLFFETKDKTQILDLTFKSLLNEVLESKGDEIQEALFN